MIPFIKCPFYVLKTQEMSCFDTATKWTDDILYKETLHDGSEDWMNFKTAKDSGINSKYVSDKSLYTMYGQGYIKDFPQDLKRADFRNQLKKLFSLNTTTPFLSDKTRAIFITLYLY
jgi:hypothetical protein